MDFTKKEESLNKNHMPIEKLKEKASNFGYGTHSNI
jgi:hypothetical protein